MSKTASRPGLSDLSPEQQEVVSIFGRGLAVLAGAGSGKTTTLVVKCEELVRRDPEARLAAVSFTERSASDLREKLRERLELGDGKHWVMTIHGLCGAILREYPREAGYDGEESMLSEPQAQVLWERAVESLWLDDVPEDVARAALRLGAREGQSGVAALLARSRQLAAFGLGDALSGSADSDARALETASRFVLDRYDRLKRRQGALDFDDLERGADRALEHEAVREAFHRRFSMVIVDEFQDTNPVQARIILRLAKPDYSNLCVVGDPKQSIYRFRDADVSLFEDFCSKLPERRSLTWNFRSRPGVIDLVNRACAPAFEVSELRYDPLVAKREAASADAVTCIDAPTPAALAAWVLAERERGVPLHEMALLLRKIRGGNEKWLKALTAAGIPVALGSGGFFWEDPRVRELVSLLRWWDNPGNSLAGAVFLRAPWVGIPDARLDAWVAGDPTFCEPFFASGHPLARALGVFREAVARPGELLLALLIDDAIEAEIGVALLGLWHRCEELSSRGLDFHAVVTELATATSENRREREVPPPRNQGQLPVLTLHASKGLEFAYVILVDLAGKRRTSPAPLLFWDRERGAYLSPRDSTGERNPKDPLESSWRELEKKRDLAESKRVFYVALTRARERLVLVYPERVGEAAEDVYATDDWRGWLEKAGVVPGAAAAAEAVTEAVPVSETASGTETVTVSETAPVTPRVPRLLRPRHSVTEWTALSRCPRHYDWRYVHPVAPAWKGTSLAPDPEPSEDDELSARELGSRVHACLERHDFPGLEALEHRVGAARFSAGPVIRWASESPLMAPEAPGREVWSELAFEIPVRPGDVLVGAIDRVVLEQDALTVIDFKVTAKPKSAEALLEAYRTQLELYAWAVRKLEPSLAHLPARAAIVNISSAGIRDIAVPLTDGFDPAVLAEASARAHAGESADPRPGPLCGSCDFRARCQRA
jgi:ATP-dependent exoDNAse (exonuclease V) beta subunit